MSYTSSNKTSKEILSTNSVDETITTAAASGCVIHALGDRANRNSEIKLDSESVSFRVSSVSDLLKEERRRYHERLKKLKNTNSYLHVQNIRFPEATGIDEYKMREAEKDRFKFGRFRSEDDYDLHDRATIHTEEESLDWCNTKASMSHGSKTSIIDVTSSEFRRVQKEWSRKPSWYRRTAKRKRCSKFRRQKFGARKKRKTKSLEQLDHEFEERCEIEKEIADKRIFRCFEKRADIPASIEAALEVLNNEFNVRFGMAVQIAEKRVFKCSLKRYIPASLDVAPVVDIFGKVRFTKGILYNGQHWRSACKSPYLLFSHLLRGLHPNADGVFTTPSGFEIHLPLKLENKAKYLNEDGKLI